MAQREIMRQLLLRRRLVHQARRLLTAPPSRKAMIERLASKEFDLVVVGGGVVGSGVALDAASRGLSVALVERADFGSGTSSRSTKLLWAGIRYMGTAVARFLSFETLKNPISAIRHTIDELRLVRAAHRERTFLLEKQSHLTQWLPICVPITRWIAWPGPPLGHPVFSIAPLILPLIFKIYDALGNFRCPPSYFITSAHAPKNFKSASLKYCAVFYEGVHDDARTNLSLALTASEHGATILNYAEATEILMSSSGKASGVQIVLRGNEDTESMEIKGKRVVLAGGPFTDDLRALEKKSNPQDLKPAVASAAGSHIVLKNAYLPKDMAMLDLATSDGRFLFVLPWHGRTLIGTTDVTGKATHSFQAPENEVKWLLSEAQTYLPQLSKDVQKFPLESLVTSSWRGWRPLASDPYDTTELAPGLASRDHIVTENPSTGLLFVVGGKWTTYRQMAQDVVDRISPKIPCRTKDITLIGGSETYSYDDILQNDVLPILKNTESAHHLVRTYGSRAPLLIQRYPHLLNRLHPAFPYIQAEAAYACDFEYAQNLFDILALRTRLAFLDIDAARQAAPRVADILTTCLDWSQQQRNRALDEALALLTEFEPPSPSLHHEES